MSTKRKSIKHINLCEYLASLIGNSDFRSELIYTFQRDPYLQTFFLTLNFEKCLLNLVMDNCVFRYNRLIQSKISARTGILSYFFYTSTADSAHVEWFIFFNTPILSSPSNSAFTYSNAVNGTPSFG